ncbi:hypothetical protein ACOMHN_023139 [Nucella lapillus]
MPIADKTAVAMMKVLVVLACVFLLSSGTRQHKSHRYQRKVFDLVNTNKTDGGWTLQEMKAFFEMIDANPKDRKVTWEEYKALERADIYMTHDIVMLYYIYDKLDGEKDCTITLQSVENLHYKMEIYLNDKDGVITKEEWMDGINQIIREYKDNPDRNPDEHCPGLPKLSELEADE